MEQQHLELEQPWSPKADVQQQDEVIDLGAYDRYVVFMSGGKDSIACVLHLLEMGVNPKIIELHHHLVDGDGDNFMDWPVTEDYCRKFAKTFDMRIFMSWKVGGFEREMLRKDARTAPIAFESIDGTIIQTGGERGKEGTRRKFPQVAASLTVRWCSSYLKVDTGARVLTTEPRFLVGKTLVITGERAEESAARAKYCSYEPHRSDNRDGARVQRHIDQWRPIHAWTESQVWDILRRWKVNPHPAYHLGWSRTSCRTCIFGSANQWSTIRLHMPVSFNRIGAYEEEFGTTIHRTRSVVEQADRGTPYDCDERWLRISESSEFNEPMIVDDWQLPKGAFGESAGPL